MPMFLGCMSSKQASSPDKNVKKKPKKRDRKEGDAIQNGGRKTDDAAENKQSANPAAPPHDVSLSQVDVTEHVTGAPDKRSSEKRQSFPPRPVTIVREDCLISEIESALGKTAKPSTQSEEQKADKPNEPKGSPQLSQPVPGAITPSESDAPTATSNATKEEETTQDSEAPPPTPPPRPKTSSQTTAASSETGDTSRKPDEEPPPSLPPRTAPTEKSAATSDVGNTELEESPPMLPPRCVPPSPPRASTASTSTAPPKPRRCSTDSRMEEGTLVRKAKPASFREPPPLPDDWAIIELPKTDAELIKLTGQPEQLAAIASRYVVKHISLHTEVRVTTELNNQIHKAFLEVARQHRSILQRFLTDLIEEQAVSSGGDSQPAEPSHGAVIGLIREILRQFVNAESIVTVSLEILQAVSGVSGATQLLVECEVTGPVLGTMSAHKSAATVQCSCLEVLARVACCPPSVGDKPPLDQSATDLICLSLDSFPKSVTVAQASCHVLSNMVNTLYKAVSTAVDRDGSASEEQDKFMTGLLTLMDYVFSKSLPAVRSALKCHDQDPTVRSRGRQFLVVYSQLEQLRQRKKRRQSGSSHHDSPPPLPARRQGGTQGDPASATRLSEQAPDPTHKEQMTNCQLDTKVPYSSYNHHLEYENWDLLRGVLKKKSSLKGHSYSKADLLFMRQLTKTQVVALVCALAVDGHVQEALKLLDQPVVDMVLTKQVPPGVRDFVAYECTPTHTLIDLDPGLFVSLIDAVRYSSVSFRMAQKCVLEVASSLDGDQQVPVVAVTVEFLASTITNPSLAPAMTVPGFVEEVCKELERAKAVSKNSAALTSLLSEIRQCARKTTHH